MDGASIYSRVGYNLRKPKNSNYAKKNKIYLNRNISILDDFEAVANESNEETLNRDSSNLKHSHLKLNTPSSRFKRLEL